ncbi:MAG: radical SAM protein [Candidatus Riflebacteria bacterium]|nr:radical SAM protein [Candidatus Riflebacteria bacterium]
MSRVLLLNPPGRLTYTRDYYCSKVTKVEYIEHPVDFVILSGILAQEHQVLFLDATLKKLSEEQAVRQILALAPEAIIFLSGTASWNEDFPFMQRVRGLLPTVPLIGSGDIFRESRVLGSEPWLDAILLDFTSGEILPFLRGERDGVQALIFRDGDRIRGGGPRRPAREFVLPPPRHELFLNMQYRFPFARYLPFATVLTDFGCPYQCRFCIYGTLGFRMRPVDNVLEELRQLHDAGVRELFVKDQAFAADRERAVRLCEGMRGIGSFSWTCFLRANCADERTLRAMRLAGCHTVMFGVESGSDAILEKYRKGTTTAEIRSSIRLCHELGLNTVGIFILGFPEDTADSLSQTVEFALDLDCDYASFNVFVPKLQTPARQELIDNHRIADNPFEIQDQSGFIPPSVPCRNPGLDVQAWRSQAMKRFYGRPSYLLKRLRKATTFVELRNLVTSALSLLRQYGKP